MSPTAAHPPAILYCTGGNVNYLKDHGTLKTPQSQPIPGRAQVKNTAGGFVFAADPWMRLQRFLVLGSEGGSYYATERTLTTENVACVRECLAEDGLRVVREIVAVSDAGRAPSNDPALFALACAISSSTDAPTRRAAAQALPEVARIGTHLYHFLSYAETMRGWGRTMRWAISNWYKLKPGEKLAYEVVKYRQRDGWSHRDALRLSHPKTGVQPHSDIFQWVTHGLTEHTEPGLLQPMIEGFEYAQQVQTPQETAALVREYRLPREALKTEHLSDPEVWHALLETGMPLGAMVRNLGNMTRLGVLDSSIYSAQVLSVLGNREQVAKSRLHPMALLIALKTYAQGHGMRGQNTWAPKPLIIDALDEAFYLAFGNVTPIGKRTLLSIDVSGSMAHGQVAGSPLTPREAAAALAMVTLRTEPECEIIGISDQAYSTSLSSRQRLDDVVRYLSTFPASRTDLSLPWQVAVPDYRGFEAFILLTDSETWAGQVHPTQRLENYRKVSGLPVRSVAVAMVANRWSIHDPDDALSLDVVGFDTATPQVISDFAGARI